MRLATCGPRQSSRSGQKVGSADTSQAPASCPASQALHQRLRLIALHQRWAPTADWCWLEADLPRGVRSTRHLKLSYSSHRIGSRATNNMGTIALDYTTHCLWLPLFAQIGTVPLWLITALTSLQKRWRQNILAPI